MPVFDAILADALQTYGIPGGALAIAKDGKLVLVRGYGLANLKTREPVSTASLFSIASISKTVTAVAVLGLIDQQKFSLDDKVYSLLGKPRPLGQPTIDPRVEQITVRQLLLHAAGWNSKANPDPLREARKIARQFQDKLPLSADAMMRYGLSQPLDVDPGKEIHYSNFCYFLAKMIVEHAARQPYESYVRQKVLLPMGITEMRLESLGPGYAVGEVRRYAGGNRELAGGREQVAAPAGNWLASPVDLIRFLTGFDGTRGKSCLSGSSCSTMIADPPDPLGKRRDGTHAAIGWDVVGGDGDDVLCRKSGVAAGVRTYIEHRPGGIDWILMLNSDGKADAGSAPVGIIIEKLQTAINATQDWPDRDLFRPKPATEHSVPSTQPHR